jgi:hypothetical protein
MIPFAEWLPDQADLNNPGATVAKNVLPHAMGYSPMRSTDAYSAALTARCQGAFSARDKSNNVYTYAADVSLIKSLSNSGWADVTRSADPYATDEKDRTEFVKWNETVIATNFFDEVQSITMGGANFANLAGSPPNAKHITTARNFVILGNVNASGTLVPNRVHWSGLNDSTTWTPAAATQADYEDIKSGGNVQRLFGGEYAVVFQESSILRMNYVGTPVIWQFDEVAPNLGLIAPGMAAQTGDVIYFLSPRGFYSIANGSQLTPIGSSKLDAFVLNDLDTGNLDRCTAVVDNSTHLVYFAYPGQGNVSGLANKIVVFDPTLNRWGYSEQDTQEMLVSATAGYTLETLDNFNSSIDAIATSLDDPVWSGGRSQIAKFDSDNKLAFFTGAPLAAVIETAELQMTPDRRTLLSAVRPLVDGGSQTVQVGYRNLQTDTEEWTTARTPNSNGRANVRKNARYHRVRVNLSGSWTHAQGVEPEASPAGWR